MASNPAASSPRAPLDPGGSPIVIAVEATRLATEVRGIGRYVRALLPRMLAQRAGARVELYVKPRDVDALAALYADQPGMRGRIDVRPIGEMRTASADVFWYPWNVVLYPPRRGAAVVVTMHDVAPLVLPDPRLRKWRKNRRWRSRYRYTAANATLFVVDSSFTADEVHRVLRVPHSRMRLALLAADDAIIPPAEDDAALLADLGVQRPYVLSVGAGDRRKNLAVVERAMARVHETLPSVSLALAGPRTHRQNLGAANTPWMRTLGFVSERALVALYRSASCLVMSSKYEGFGLPVLEAMQFGIPVICARTSSLPEVGGDAVQWVDPDDDVALADAITRVVSDESLAAEMRAAGLARAARFRWDDTAGRTLAAFDEAIGMSAVHERADAPGHVGRIAQLLQGWSRAMTSF